MFRSRSSSSANQACSNATGEVAGRANHAFVCAGQGDPLGAEGALVLVQAEHRLARLRLVTGAGDVDPTEIHLHRILADCELDRTPAQEMERAGVLLARIGPVAGERGR